MNEQALPRWGKDTEVVVRDATFRDGRGPGYLEVIVSHGDLRIAELCPPTIIGATIERALHKLAHDVGRRVVFA
ncbi:hypothetical protein [Xanthomonas campestris]|uniref:hypothetical protein n=1 Tax=Xanthomonas campestris TaxID=339 RepID=UPI0005AF3CA4|nr:hypothetical protein [Xanthomonas campestris]KIQ29384.1 hypothetical protein RT95_02045 [Xanthomonas campestris]